MSLQNWSYETHPSIFGRAKNPKQMRTRICRGGGGGNDRLGAGRLDGKGSELRFTENQDVIDGSTDHRCRIGETELLNGGVELIGRRGVDDLYGTHGHHVLDGSNVETIRHFLRKCR